MELIGVSKMDGFESKLGLPRLVLHGVEFLFSLHYYYKSDVSESLWMFCRLNCEVDWLELCHEVQWKISFHLGGLLFMAIRGFDHLELLLHGY